MTRFGRLDPSMVAELERLIAKLAAAPGQPAFTPRERELMESIRAARDSILPSLHAEIGRYRGLNDRGREKLEALVVAIERICARAN